MALLYNVCSYNGLSGGRYQSSVWDSCCPDWEKKDDQNPSEFTCWIPLSADYSGGGINGVQWQPHGPGTPDWGSGDNANPAGWSTFTWSADWNDGDNTNPQSWSCTLYQGEWQVGGAVNPQGFTPQTGTEEWAEPTPPEAVEYKPYIRRDQSYCGN